MSANLVQWAKEAYKTDEWLRQSERKRNCFYNICTWGHRGTMCEIEDHKCEECKAFNYMPMGLEALVENGFEGIKARQNGGKHGRAEQ